MSCAMTASVASLKCQSVSRSQLAYLLVATGLSVEDVSKNLVDVDEIESSVLEGTLTPPLWANGCKINTRKSLS